MINSAGPLRNNKTVKGVKGIIEPLANFREKNIYNNMLYFVGIMIVLGNSRREL
jgi:hypothetical protein